MINYKIFKKNGISIKSIKKINNAYLISTKKSKYIVKENKENLSKKFNYLKSRNFNYFPKYYKIENYDVYEYIENNDISKEEKLSEIINLISLLHTKTTRYKKIDIDDYKIIYEDISKKIDYLNNYYITLNDSIDNEIYMSPSNYLLALNISKIYGVLSFCKNELDNWYELIKNSTKQRQVLIHNNLDISHIIFSSNPYLISWNKSKISIPIYDLITLYKKYHNDIDFEILLNNYQKRYPLTKEELKLFFIIISIPEKINLKNNEFENVKIVKNLIDKISKGDSLIRPYYEKNKKNV